MVANVTLPAQRAQGAAWKLTRSLTVPAFEIVVAQATVES